MTHTPACPTLLLSVSAAVAAVGCSGAAAPPEELQALESFGKSDSASAAFSVGASFDTIALAQKAQSDLETCTPSSDVASSTDFDLRFSRFSVIATSTDSVTIEFEWANVQQESYAYPQVSAFAPGSDAAISYYLSYGEPVPYPVQADGSINIPYVAFGCQSFTQRVVVEVPEEDDFVELQLSLGTIGEFADVVGFDESLWIVRNP